MFHYRCVRTVFYDLFYQTKQRLGSSVIHSNPSHSQACPDTLAWAPRSWHSADPPLSNNQGAIFDGFRFRYCQDVDETPMMNMGVPGHLRCRGGGCDKVGNAKECQGLCFSYILLVILHGWQGCAKKRRTVGKGERIYWWVFGSQSSVPTGHVENPKSTCPSPSGTRERWKSVW